MELSALNTLDAKVAAINFSHAEANRWFDILKEVFAPYVGQKVCNADGQIIAKIRKNLPELPARHDLEVDRRVSEYGLNWKVVARVSHPRGTEYYSTEFSIGYLRNGILTEISKNKLTARTDYTAEEVRRLREEYKEVQKKLPALTNVVEMFGEYDL